MDERIVKEKVRFFSNGLLLFSNLILIDVEYLRQDVS